MPEDVQGTQGAPAGQGDNPAPGQGQAGSPASSPAFDAEALKNLIQNTISTSLASAPRSNEEPREEPRVAPVAQPTEVDPLTKMIAPVVAPALNQVNTLATAAMDAARFYGSGSAEDRELRNKYADDIERKFDELLRAGRPAPRADILNWLIGGPKRSEYVEFEIKRRQEKADQAKFAETAGSGTFRAEGPIKPLEQMSDDELAQLVEKAGGA